MFQMSDNEQSPCEERGATAETISETSPFLPQAARVTKPEVAHDDDHADTARRLDMGPSAAHLDPVEEAAETSSDLANSILDQLRDLRSGAGGKS